MPHEMLLPPAPAPRVGTSPGVIVAIILASAALALSLLVALVSVGTLAYLALRPDPAGGWVGGGDLVDVSPGTVKAADGSPVEGVGTVDRPAHLGEHTLSWPTFEGGVLDVTVTEVDWDAAEVLTDASAPEPGMAYVLATMDLAYTGPGAIAPAVDLWVSLETWSWFCSADELRVESENSLWDVGVLSDGEAAEVTVVLEMLEEERSSALLIVETADGEPLFLAEG